MCMMGTRHRFFTFEEQTGIALDSPLVLPAGKVEAHPEKLDQAGAPEHHGQSAEVILIQQVGRGALADLMRTLGCLERSHILGGEHDVR
jgi:hypothetical protein